MSDTHAVPDALSPHVASKTRGDFVAILDRLGISIILSTRPNLIVCLGALDGDLTLSATMLSQPMGLAVDAGRIAVATARTVMIFANVSRLAPHYPGKPNHYDAYFVPRTIHMTGDCHMHDMVFQGQTLIGVTTNFSCVCRIGRSIVQERGLERVSYFHVELDSHDVLLAEGSPSESFLEEGNRGQFHNAAEHAAMYPGSPAPGGRCAPWVDSGFELEAIRARLAEAAGAVARAA